MYEVKTAEVKDCDELSNLVNSAYRGDSSRAGWTTEADYLDGQRTHSILLKSEIENKNKVILCLRQVGGSQILACVLLERVTDEKGEACYLGMLTVLPTLQAGGVGKYLLGEAEEFARKWGLKRMTLCVIQIRDSLISWYERRGYVRTAKERPFPYGDPDFGIPTREDLKFVYFDKTI